MTTNDENNALHCEICNEPVLPENLGPQARHTLCGNRSCTREMKRRVIPTQWIKEGERHCDGPHCSIPMPAGTYSAHSTRYFCTKECRAKYYKINAKPNTRCRECKKPIYRPYPDQRHYCSSKCQCSTQMRENIDANAGVFAPILREYEHVFGKNHYRLSTFYSVRSYLLDFFRFLTASGIEDLEQVKPAVITRFAADLMAKGTSVNNAMNAVSTFMKWLIVEGRRTAGNPVIPRFHRHKTPKRLPRPYSDQEMATIWQLIDERGDARIKLAVAIGEESGLRISEVCNLRLGDVDRVGQKLFVRLPNKTNQERWVPFHDNTCRYLDAWLKERPDCDHDHLICNQVNGPMFKQSMTLLLNSVLRKDFRTYHHQTGLKSFSFHRLRHRFGSVLGNRGVDASVIMAMGGWSSFEAMQKYVEVRPETITRAYNAAMQQRKVAEPTTESMSLEDFTNKRNVT